MRHNHFRHGLELMARDSEEHRQRAHRQQDEYFCPRCEKRWAVGEEPPPCQ